MRLIWVSWGSEVVLEGDLKSYNKCSYIFLVLMANPFVSINHTMLRDTLSLSVSIVKVENYMPFHCL